MAADRAFIVMPCLAAAETVSECKRNNQKALTNRKGNIDPVDAFSFLSGRCGTENAVIVIQGRAVASVSTFGFDRAGSRCVAKYKQWQYTPGALLDVAPTQTGKG